MEPVTLTLTLDLDREVQGQWKSGLAGYESDGTPIEGAFPEQRTFADVVADLAARQLLADIVRDKDRYSNLRQQVATIRDEEIRAAVRPLVMEALAGTVQRTDEWGAPKGEPSTLREMVIKAATDALTKPTSRDGRSIGSKQETLVQAVVREQVEASLRKELTDIVTQAKAEVLGAVRSNVSTVLAAAVVNGVTKGR